MSLSWFPLVALAVGAVMVAKSATFVLGSEPFFRGHPRPLPQDPVSFSSALDAARLAALTGLPRAKAAPSGVREATQPTRLHLRALGTLIGDDSRWVTIEDLDTGRVHTLTEGDRVQEALVVRIARSLITLREGDLVEYRDIDVPRVHPGGRFTYLEVSGVPGPGAPRPAEAAPAVTVGETGERRLSRAEVERQLANFAELATTVRVVPSGQGFKLFGIRPGSLVEQLGLKNGDRLLKVDGLELSSPEAVMDAYQRLRSASRLEVELERQGATVRQRYSIE